MSIILATHNPHKLHELRAIIGSRYPLISLNDLQFTDDIPEPYPTLEENALEKAQVLAQLYPNYAVIAEDTGLEVFALHGEPGVKTARYAGTGKSKDNMQLLLHNLQGIEMRQAQFRTIIALIFQTQSYLFEGKVTGNIALQVMGNDGFGYDPVFIPDGYTQSFAQMLPELKNSMSHRRKAADKLAHFLQSNPMFDAI